MFRYFRSTVLGNCAIELDGDVYQLFMDGQLATKNLRRRWAADRKSEDAGVLAGRHAPDVQIGNFCRHRTGGDHFTNFVDDWRIHLGIEPNATGGFQQALSPHQNQTGAQLGRATSELQSLMRISYAVFSLKKKKNETNLAKSDRNRT